MKRLLILTLALGSVVAANATNLVTNGDFEDPATGNTWITGNPDGDYTYGPFTGWSIGAGTSGVWRPNLGANTFSALPSGTQAGWSSDSGAVSFMVQNLSHVMVLGETISFSTFIGNRSDLANYGLGGAGWARLIASDNTLLGDSGNVTATAGTFKQYATSFSVGAALAGKTMSVELGNVAGSQASFDNVEVNAVPEPFTMSLGLASAGLFLRRRLRSRRS